MANLLTTLHNSNPVRLYVYSLLVPVLAVLLAFGIVDATQVPLYIALGTAVLGVTATETARSAVTPAANLPAPCPDTTP